VSVRVFAHLDALSQAAAALVTQTVREAAASRGRAALALAGGRTPLRLYELLAEEPGALPWDRVHLFWGDERVVPHGHEASNYGAAARALIGRVPISLDNVHPVPTDAPDPEACARAYERTLRDFFGEGAAETFDLVLLGMGADGHTASLFPGDPALDERERWVRAASAPEGSDPRARVTLTLPALAAGRAACFLVTGADKARALREILDGDGAARYPAGQVQTRGGVSWLVDRAAREGDV